MGRACIIVVMMASTCKPQVGEVKTAPSSTFEELREYHNDYVTMAPLGIGYNLNIFIDLESMMTAALDEGKLDEGKLTAEQHEHVLKMRHKIRSMIAFTIRTGCLLRQGKVMGASGHGSLSEQLYVLSKRQSRQDAGSWRAFYNMKDLKEEIPAIELNEEEFNELIKNKSKDAKVHTKKLREPVFKINSQQICAMLLMRMKELIPEQIDHTYTNEQFFDAMMLLSAQGVRKFISKDATNTYDGLIWNFFQNGLLPKVINNTKRAMAEFKQRFAFHRESLVVTCEQRKEEKTKISLNFTTENIQGKRKIQTNINCDDLGRLPKPKSVLTQPTEVGDGIIFAVGDKGSILSPQPYRNAAHVLKDIDLIVRIYLNLERAALHKLVHAGGRSHVTKRPLILPFFKVFQDLNLASIKSEKHVDDDGNMREMNPVIGHYDRYHEVLFQAAQMGLLPLIMKLHQKSDYNPGIHLDHQGDFFGFAKPNYYPLPLLGKENGVAKVTSALDELQQELVDSWLEAQILRLHADSSIDTQKIYTWMLAHEIATAQVILQDPSHATAVAALISKHSSDPITPKWLRYARKVFMGAEVGFIALILLPAVPVTMPLMLASTALNFLWIGASALSARQARQRLRLAERALLSGNSQQVHCGMLLLQKFYQKRRDANFAATVGGALTVTGLGKVAKGLDGKAGTFVVEMGAALSSDVEGITSVDDDKITEEQLMQQCFGEKK